MALPPPPVPPVPPAPVQPCGPGRPMLSRAASVLKPEAQEEMISALENEGAKLEEKIREITAARRHGGHADVEDRAMEEQLNAKAAMINKLQEELSEEVNRMEQGSNLKEEIHQYEAHRATLNREIQNAKDAMDHSDVGKLRDEVHRAEERSRQLTAQLQRLEANSFLSKVDDRKEANMRISALEELLRSKTAEHQGQVDENMKSQHNRLMMVQEKQRLQARCLDLKQRNERLQIEITTQQAEMQKVEREMRLMRERLPPDNQEALEMALAEVVGSRGAAFSRLERPEAAVPSAEDLQGTGSMERVLERLGQERDDLRRQIAVLRMDLERESAVSKNFKALQAQELEDARSKSQSFLRDREKWCRISAAHLQSIQDLQRRIAGFETMTLNEKAPDTLSLAGFSDVSDLEDAANALDVFVGVGEIDLSAAQRLQEELNRWVSEVPVAPPMPSVVEELRSLVSIELIGFDLGFSAVASGLQPVYDSLVTFGPFNVNDATLDQFAQGHLKVEIHGTLPGSEKQHLLGQGLLPMLGLLQYGTQDTRNPVAGGVVAVKDPNDHDILVAKLRIKLRLRYSIEELAEDYITRARVRQQDRGGKK